MTDCTSILLIGRPHPSTRVLLARRMQCSHSTLDTGSGMRTCLETSCNRLLKSSNSWKSRGESAGEYIQESTRSGIWCNKNELDCRFVEHLSHHIIIYTQTDIRDTNSLLIQLPQQGVMNKVKVCMNSDTPSCPPTLSYSVFLADIQQQLPEPTSDKPTSVMKPPHAARCTTSLSTVQGTNCIRGLIDLFS